MKNRFALASCLLLLWTFTVFVSCQDKKDGPVELKVKEVADGIELACSDQSDVTSNTNTDIKTKSLHLPYRDNSTGEYKCGENELIYVKFRTCDSCVEVDTPSLISMVVGNVVATIVVGVGVYLIASQTSQTRTGPVVSNKKSKSSDRQHLVSETRGPTNDHYQPLRRGGQKDTYDELVHRR
uniref:T-cell surface glycoprotein CD3 gamma chain n=1 Tax=Maylandia zebra TaxID=106582 RepID=UPI000D3148AA|nr:T-cell surface glycoprotein CD3 gamma chain [Maylandia zebra]XP_024660778.1 T-cell surface glycoprotein CD3 gamma chain [Maylandia zebra]